LSRGGFPEIHPAVGLWDVRADRKTRFEQEPRRSCVRYLDAIDLNSDVAGGLQDIYALKTNKDLALSNEDVRVAAEPAPCMDPLDGGRFVHLLQTRRPSR
jgi:hypothetical protein